MTLKTERGVTYLFCGRNFLSGGERDSSVTGVPGCGQAISLCDKMAVETVTVVTVM